MLYVNACQRAKENSCAVARPAAAVDLGLRDLGVFCETAALFPLCT
jgi:hypothetical protein